MWQGLVNCQQKLTGRSPLERQQLRDFKLVMRGRRSRLWGITLLLVFTLCGVALHLHEPGIGWAVAILVANMFGISLTIAFVGAWFNYRQFSQHKLKMLLAVLGFAVFSAVAATGVSMWMEGQPLAHAMKRVSDLVGGVLVGSMTILVPVLVISMLRNRQYEA